MSAQSRKACVIGWPIGHSRSPLIHGHWLARHGIDGSYEAVEVAPDDLAAFVEALRKGAYVGCNVTVPHKEQVAGLADEADALVKRLGAANMLTVRDGRVLANNTDGHGFLAHLAASVPEFRLQGATVTMLGAGGAARAIAGALLDGGAGTVRIVNRTAARAEALGAELAGNAEPWAWEERDRALPGCDLLINTTVLGMTGKASLDLRLDGLPRSAVVYDIVYVPLETELLRQAAERGNRTVDGLGMLLHQAAPGFEAWFGVRPQVDDALRAIVVADIKARP